MKEKLKLLREAIALIEKQFGKGAILSLDDRQAAVVPSISSGAPSLDLALGCGGYPRGRVVEVFGPESSGKTTLALHVIAECQRAGGTAAFIDAEHALDVIYARAIGVNAEKLLVSQPDTGEQALDIAEALVKSQAVDIVVVDSVAALVPQAEIEGAMGDAHVGLQARLMSQALRKLTGIAYRNETLVVFINQLRQKIGVVYGSPETTPGGQALKFYASVRLDVRKVTAIKAGDEVTGQRTRVKVVKNKMAPPFRVVEFDIRYGTGIDALADLLDLAVQREIVEKNGSHYRYLDQALGQGREKARQTLLDTPELAQRLREQVLRQPSPALATPEQDLEAAA